MSEARALLTPEEIATRGAPQLPYVRLPERASAFADREVRLRQLSASHPMRDYLLFAAELARAQQALLNAHPALALPSQDDVDAAGLAGMPPLPAAGWPRDPAWRSGLAQLIAALLPRVAGSPAEAVLRRVADTDDAEIERQADRLLAGVMLGLDLGAAPLLAAALQVHWTHLVLATAAGRTRAFDRTDDATLCPCCGSRPTASVTRIGSDAAGYRYLHCSLCSAQWHMVRIKCTHCQGTSGIGYQSLEPAGGAALRPLPAKDAVQVETCDACNHYLKIVHMERDRDVEPVADDLASLTLDLLVSDAGRQRHGVNLLLLFGDPDAVP